MTTLEIDLRLQTAVVRLNLKKKTAEGGYFDLKSTVQWSFEISRGLFESVPTTIHTSDVTRLEAYVDNHLQALETNPHHVSPCFVPLELGFQFQLFSGEIEDQQGVITLQCMINMGRPSSEFHYLYAGVQGSLDIEVLREFIAHLKEFVNSPISK